MVPSVRYSTVAGIPLSDLVKMKWITKKKLIKLSSGHEMCGNCGPVKKWISLLHLRSGD